MYSFEAVSRIKLPYDVNYSQKLMSKSLKLEEVSIYSQVDNTRGGVFYFFTARRYASAVLDVIVCLSVRLSVRPSVRLSVCLSQVGVVQRWLNLGSD